MVNENDTVVCRCKKITIGKIKEAVKNGCETVDELVEKTGCCTACGNCESEIQAIMDLLVK